MHMNFEPWVKKISFSYNDQSKGILYTGKYSSPYFCSCIFELVNFHFQVFKIETQQFLAKVRRN